MDKKTDTVRPRTTHSSAECLQVIAFSLPKTVLIMKSSRLLKLAPLKQLFVSDKFREPFFTQR
jgi:hypothetical protein